MNAPVDLPPRGLPEHLPDDERILWQGAPEWRSFARRALHVRGIAIYFALMLGWRILSDWTDGGEIGGILLSGARFVVFAGIAIGILYLFAWLAQCTTVYTITNRRVVMRIGIALPVTFNIPFSAIETVRLAEGRDGSGDLPLVLAGSERIAYLHMMPHARPWCFSRPEPMLRAVPRVGEVANVIARAMQSASLPGSADLQPAAAARTDNRRAGAVALARTTEEIPV